MVYSVCMANELKKLLEAAEKWPADAQQELVDAGNAIESNQKSYLALVGELGGIDRGQNAAKAGEFATQDEVKDAFAAFLA